MYYLFALCGGKKGVTCCPPTANDQHTSKMAPYTLEFVMPELKYRFLEIKLSVKAFFLLFTEFYLFTNLTNRSIEFYLTKMCINYYFPLAFCSTYKRSTEEDKITFLIQW